MVAAHSYGGLIADLLARTRPDLVSGLVMIDPVSGNRIAAADPRRDCYAIAY